MVDTEAFEVKRRPQKSRERVLQLRSPCSRSQTAEVARMSG